ncbi:hypothetical protein G5B39_12500 [Rhodobacteraceae bacterium SC52]|nr:hypothetical protein G5B39_12500 [Rhodobacteraceae bacterium SC52]
MTFHPPKPLGDATTHYWLVQDMARAAGVDLAAEVESGNLTTENWSNMVQRCRGCAWERDGGCSRWMAAQEADDPIDVPSLCENVETFAKLRMPAAE